MRTIQQESALSREFGEFIRKIGEMQSKQEEERIVMAEIRKLKQRLSQPGITSKMMKEYLIRLIHCEMLGHEVSFAYIHALNLAQSSKLLPEKCVGYLAASLFLHPDHELTILLVQSILKVCLPHPTPHSPPSSIHPPSFIHSPHPIHSPLHILSLSNLSCLSLSLGSQQQQPH